MPSIGWLLIVFWLPLLLAIGGLACIEHSSPRDDTTSNSKDDSDVHQCSLGLQEVTVPIDRDLSLRILQAPTAFEGVEHDRTGTVVWGASVCLARFLADKYATIMTGDNKVVMELGCGCGLPSLVMAAKQRSGQRVVATDLEPATLEQLDAVAQLNNLQDRLELFQLDWNDSFATTINDKNSLMAENGGDLLQANVILASDVIYHREMVDPLVQTIGKYLATNESHHIGGETAYLALRNSRQGVTSFWQEAMPKAGFSLVSSISCDHYLGVGTGKGDAEAVPLWFQYDANSHRWRGDHTVYVFQRRTDVEKIT
jgi:predicted nicotinamide N-methyase